MSKQDKTIKKRISVYFQVPVKNGELIQVLRCKGCFWQFNLKRGGQRVATMLMYLSDNVDGGETYFQKSGSGECSCGGKMVPGFIVKPVKGDAVLFWSMGSMDNRIQIAYMVDVKNYLERNGQPQNG